jgi:dUTP pyrophosphatase
VPRIPLVPLDPDLPVPTYAKPGDAGMDLRARERVVIPAAGGRAIVPSGIRVAIPEGFAGFVLPRSGLARDHGITCLNTPGLVDSGYRGEIMVLLVNTDPTNDFTVERGERIAQMVIQRYEHVEFDIVDELEPSERGSGGFGHTGR